MTTSHSNPNNKQASERFVLGWMFLQQGNLDDAIDCFKEALRLQPDNMKACVNLSLAYARQRNYNAAIRCCREALRMGRAYADMGNYANALRCCRRAAHLTPEEGVVQCNMGEAYAGLGQYAHAIRCYEDALRLNPHDTHAQYGLMLAQQARRKPLIARIIWGMRSSQPPPINRSLYIIYRRWRGAGGASEGEKKKSKAEQITSASPSVYHAHFLPLMGGQ